ncbi:hypothetical protein ACFQY7_13750 [Actinomadura luteofluorescens]|uniref:hypothetical protein n=1 Tax=Actinomadura luteofluorescens TaxID=46163 RepID=UPI0036269CF9
MTTPFPDGAPLTGRPAARRVLVSGTRFRAGFGRSPTIQGMTVPPEELELAAAFPTADRDRWREMVKGVLRKSGAASEDTPSTRSRAC